ncbi:MAG: hypothetical protein HRT67_11475 [Flavobacteriaceae bacterium]|nr:hypothetical protein [Flavobacteriaceae bacterium]
MHKRLFSIFFSIIFLAVVALPTIDQVLLDGFDMEIEISIDEEESKDKKTLEFKMLMHREDYSAHIALHTSNIDDFYHNSYADLHLECFCPPPEYC